MDNIPIECFACGISIPEKDYLKHMETTHGTKSQQEAMAKSKAIEQNTPKDLPPGVTADDLPDPDFLATLAEMQKAEQEQKNQPATPPPLSLKPEKPAVANPGASQTPSTPSKIELTYKYTGSCENNHSVSTLEMDVEQKHFVIAFCLQCNKQIENREVENLKMMNDIIKTINEHAGKILEDVRKEDALKEEFLKPLMEKAKRRKIKN